jgi:hypothetical protein
MYASGLLHFSKWRYPGGSADGESAEARIGGKDQE